MPEGGKMDSLDFKEEILCDGKVLSVGQLSQAFYFSAQKTGLPDWFSEISWQPLIYLLLKNCQY